MSNNLGLGEVKQCAHCDGNGVCKAGFGNMRSCKVCLVKAGIDQNAMDVITCATCGGKGSVWVGPEVVQIVGTPGTGPANTTPGKRLG
jgi:RecJ-like exonuclease